MQEPQDSLRSTQLAEQRISLAAARSHLAKERAHRAYLRTAVLLMSVGFTLNRFSIYLEESGQRDAISPGRSMLRDASNVGWGLVVLGTFLLILALWRYRTVSKQISKCRLVPKSHYVTGLTIVVILLGAFSAAWLFATWHGKLA